MPSLRCLRIAVLAVLSPCCPRSAALAMITPHCCPCSAALDLAVLAQSALMSSMCSGCAQRCLCITAPTVLLSHRASCPRSAVLTVMAVFACSCACACALLPSMIVAALERGFIGTRSLITINPNPNGTRAPKRGAQPASGIYISRYLSSNR